MDSLINELAKLGFGVDADPESSVPSSHNRAIAKNGAVPGGQILAQGAVPISPFHSDSNGAAYLDN